MIWVTVYLHPVLMEMIFNSTGKKESSITSNLAKMLLPIYFIMIGYVYAIITYQGIFHCPFHSEQGKLDLLINSENGENISQ